MMTEVEKQNQQKIVDKLCDKIKIRFKEIYPDIQTVEMYTVCLRDIYTWSICLKFGRGIELKWEMRGNISTADLEWSASRNPDELVQHFTNYFCSVFIRCKK